MPTDNTPVIVAGRDLLEGEEITLGVMTYRVAADTPAGTILYWIDGALRPWPAEPPVTRPGQRRRTPRAPRTAPGTRMKTDPPDSAARAPKAATVATETPGEPPDGADQDLT